MSRIVLPIFNLIFEVCTETTYAANTHIKRIETRISIETKLNKVQTLNKKKVELKLK